MKLYVPITDTERIVGRMTPEGVWQLEHDGAPVGSLQLLHAIYWFTPTEGHARSVGDDFIHAVEQVRDLVERRPA